MPEGPSLVIAKEEMNSFIGKKVITVSGNTKTDKERILNKKLLDIKTWGKHLLLCFKGFTIRIHFLMFGKYLVNARREVDARLSMQFKDGEINLYTCSVKFIEEPLDEIYDWAADVLSDAWDPKAAKKKLKAAPNMMVTDALLDQTIFAGVGNIIKNEVLYRIKVHPKNKVGDLPTKQLNELIREARNYSFDFLKWKKEYTLRKHWLAHTKKTCARDGDKIIKEYLGKTQRRTFFCNTCQVLYDE
ncbi:MAG TPA: DNA-formamidopyrimidine glycosylase family protein [Flavisolibacter sp.]|jgi:endonuclease-8|nr:DNA-formamidopyrimidine glycosylase family protein [Flavisolibacter sp.]